AAVLGCCTLARDESGRQQGKHEFATLVCAGAVGLQDAPSGPRLRSPLRDDHVEEADGVVRQHRLDPAQLPKPGRRSSNSYCLATRRGLPGKLLVAGHQELHVDRSDVPARCRKRAEWRFAAFLLIEMKPLRIVLPGKSLDVISGEGE